MEKKFAAFIAAVGWCALVLQFVLMMTNPDSQGVSVIELVIRYFSYFTIHINILAALTASAVAFFPNTFFTRPKVQAAVATFISIGGIVYSLFLRSVWDPQGWQAVADHSLHDAMPLLFVIYWLIFAPKAGLTWIDPFKWLLYPFAYIIYSIARGAIVGWYPYHFADASQLGYPVALRNAGFVLVAFLVVGLLIVALAKWMDRTQSSNAT